MRKDAELKKEFGISIYEYEDLLEKQRGVCAICGKKETHKLNGVTKMLAIDHDHTSGKVRGLLCASCNLLLGHSKDSPEVLIAAASYLLKERQSV